MTHPVLQVNGTINLQATLSASSAGQGEPIEPHHPITCPSTLWYEEDGTLRCEHATAPPGDIRTRQCIDHSIAVLLMELADWELAR